MCPARHVYRIFVKAPIHTVWSAIVDPEFTRRYFHTTAFVEPPRQGEAYTMATAEGHPAIDGTIEVLEAPHRLVMTWHTLYDAALAEEPASRVEWTLHEAGEGLTQVDLVHGDLFGSPLTWANVRDGWVWILDGLKTVVETGESLPPVAAPAPPVEDPRGQWHRSQGIECNNSVWEMIEAERTSANDEEMLRRAYSSAYHWQRAAGAQPVNEARALWMLAKVHLLVGLPDRSLHYAQECMRQCELHGLVDFDLAYAFEARARALQALGHVGAAAQDWAAAHAVPIADPDDRAILDGDLAVGP